MDDPGSGERHDGPRRRPRRAASGLAQLPWRTLVNPFKPLEILSADHIEAIHRSSLRILSEIGMEVLGDRALDALSGAGAMVDRLTRNVRVDPAQVEGLIALGPAEFRLHARNPDRNLLFGGTNLVFGAVGGPAFVSDLDRGRRAGNFADFVDYVRIIGALDIIHQEGGGPLEPTDLPVETRHLDMYRTFATELDKTWQCLGFGARPVDDALEVVALIRGVDRNTLLREPSLMTVINTNSPLRLDGPMSDGLMEMALYGQPVVATPFTLAGAMSPVSLAGALAQQNAEALFLVALAQMVRPGAPMVYGAFTSNVDMRTGAPAFGTPESVKGAIASGQLARRYGLPWRSSNTTASNVVDAQAAYESEMAVWGALMGGVNLLYQGAGWLEGGLTASYEKLIIDAEILQMLSEVLQPLPVDAASLGFEAIAEVGPGGHFFGTAHTLERYETAFYRPLVSDWRNFETWQADGARTATERANSIWKRLLAEAAPPALDPSIVEALDALVARRKREIRLGALSSTAPGAAPCYNRDVQETDTLDAMIEKRFDRTDRRITGWMADHGLLLLRIALGVVFFWFGALKLIPGASPAEALAGATIERLSGGLVPAATALPILALWEVAIGIGLFIGRAMRVTLLLLFVQMLGAVTPLVLFPTETFSQFPWAPTLEGQYIIKNVIIVAAAIVLGATVRGGQLTAEPPRD